jgi:hypothetical protein
MMKLIVAFRNFANALKYGVFSITTFHLSVLSIAIGLVVEMKRSSESQLLTTVILYIYK